MNNNPSLHGKPYERVQLFSGGGYRFGYYLGSYAALCEQGLKPELILATCGGSLASLLVDIAPDTQDLQSLLESEALYKVIRASQHRQNFALNPLKQKPSYFSQGLKRLGLSKYLSRLNAIHSRETSAQLLAELNHFAMFEISNEATWLEELIKLKPDSKTDNQPDVAIIASRIMPIESDVRNESKTKNQQPLAKLQEVLFTPNSLLTHIDEQTLHCPTHRYAPDRIIQNIHTVADWDIAQAVRASTADMYYLQPTHIDHVGWSLGGVIDLTPIELASQFGNTVFTETKNGYDKVLAAPAIQRIFGFDPNQRLEEVLSYQDTIKQNDIHWLPFADNGKALAGQHVQKRLNIKARHIDLIHADYDEFVKQMQAQWHYGYERTLRYLQTNNLA